MKYDLFVPGQEVVQRLFEDQEDEQGRNLRPSADQPDEDSAKRVDGISSRDEQQGTAARPLFPQTPHRESVIFFSTGKKLLRAPCFELQDNSGCEEVEEEEESPLPSVQHKLLPAREKAPCTSEPTGRISPSALPTGSATLSLPPPHHCRSVFCAPASHSPPSPPQASALRRPAR